MKLEERGINIVCAAQNSETQGKQRAREAGIPLMTLDEIIDLGPAVDVIFDLTGDPGVRRYLRMRMQKTGNCHTIVAPETLARMLWAVISDEDLGDKHGAGGYR